MNSSKSAPLRAIFMTVLAVSIPCGAQELRSSIQADGGLCLGKLASVCPASFGGSLGFEVRDVGLDALVLGMELGCEAYSLDADWVESLSRARGLAWGGWRFPLSSAFGVTPRAGAGIGYVFGSASFAGNDDYESLSAFQFLALAGTVADYRLSESLSLRASFDCRLAVEPGGAHSCLCLGAGLSWKLIGSPRIAGTSTPAKADGSADAAAKLAASLSSYPSIRVISRDDGLRLVLEGTFAANSSDLTGGAKELLSAAARAASSLKPVKVVILGYAARDDRAETDVPISKARAESARGWLGSMGFFPGVEVGISAMGSASPVGDNGTATGRARNRRVEIDIVLGSSANK